MIYTRVYTNKTAIYFVGKFGLLPMTITGLLTLVVVSL